MRKKSREIGIKRHEDRENFVSALDEASSFCYCNYTIPQCAAPLMETNPRLDSKQELDRWKYWFIGCYIIKPTPWRKNSPLRVDSTFSWFRVKVQHFVPILRQRTPITGESCYSQHLPKTVMKMKKGGTIHGEGINSQMAIIHWGPTSVSYLY